MWLMSQKLFWIFLSLVVAVHGQGGGGGGGGGLAGLAGLGIFIIVGPFYCCYLCFAGKPKHSNEKFVTKSQIANDEEKYILGSGIFQSGQWNTTYFQYKQWHGPHQMELTFDSLQSKITGSGIDNIGTFSIDGIYSTLSGRVAFTKKYYLGTGNPAENLGHSVIIQLQWNTMNHQFEGKWYVRTKKFKGSGEFKMSVDKGSRNQLLLPVYEKY